MATDKKTDSFPGKVLRALVAWGIPLVGVLYVFQALFSGEALPDFGELRWLPFTGAFLCMGIAFLFLVLNSFFLVCDTGRGIPFRRYAGIWFIGNMGKYVPGKVFLVLSRAGLMDRESVGPMNSVMLLLGENLILMVTALAAGGAGYLLGTGAAVPAFFIVVFPAPLLAVLAGPVNRALHWGLRKLRHRESPLSFSASSVALSTLAGTLAWAFYGLSGSLAASGLGLEDGLTRFPLFWSVLPLAWLLGFLVFIVPGGIGVREASAVFLLQSALTGPVASALSILLRFLWILLELLGWGVGQLGRLRLFSWRPR